MDETVNEMQNSALQCAVAILDLMPVVMGSLRCRMRRDSTNSLTMVQFRVLAFLERHQAASLSKIAEFLELGLPTTSKTVDGLVNSRLIERHVDPEDRRRVLLEASAAGKKEVRATREIAEACLAKMLEPLPDADRGSVRNAMELLRPLFRLPKICE